MSASARRSRSGEPTAGTAMGLTVLCSLGAPCPSWPKDRLGHPAAGSHPVEVELVGHKARRRSIPEGGYRPV